MTSRQSNAPLRHLRIEQVLVSHLIGGAGLVAMRLAQLVRDAGGESHAWVPGAGPAAAFLAEAGIPCHRYRLDQMTGGPALHGLACLRMALRLLGRRRLVHIHTPAVFRFMRPALRVARARTIVHVQIEPAAEEIRWAFRDPPDLVVTCAEYLVDAVREALPVHQRGLPILAIPNPVDLDRFFPGDRAAAKLAIGAHPDRPLVLMVANLAPHKGQTTAVQAAGILRQRGIAVDCWFAGEERDPRAGFRSQLEALAQHLGIADHTRFLGFRSDGPDLMRAADVFLLPSTHEGLPISILEAQATRTAVVASPEPGIREIIEPERTGFLVAPDDPHGYADRIETLLAKPDLYAHLTARAFDHVVQQYSWKAFADRLVHVYLHMASSAKLSPGLALCRPDPSASL